MQRAVASGHSGPGCSGPVATCTVAAHAQPAAAGHGTAQAAGQAPQPQQHQAHGQLVPHALPGSAGHPYKSSRLFVCASSFFSASPSAEWQAGTPPTPAGAGAQQRRRRGPGRPSGASGLGVTSVERRKGRRLPAGGAAPRSSSGSSSPSGSSNSSSSSSSSAWCLCSWPRSARSAPLLVPAPPCRRRRRTISAFGPACPACRAVRVLVRARLHGAPAVTLTPPVRRATPATCTRSERACSGGAAGVGRCVCGPGTPRRAAGTLRCGGENVGGAPARAGGLARLLVRPSGPRRGGPGGTERRVRVCACLAWVLRGPGGACAVYPAACGCMAFCQGRLVCHPGLVVARAGAPL